MFRAERLARDLRACLAGFLVVLWNRWEGFSGDIFRAFALTPPTLGTTILADTFARQESVRLIVGASPLRHDSSDISSETRCGFWG